MNIFRKPIVYDDLITLQHKIDKFLRSSKRSKKLVILRDKKSESQDESFRFVFSFNFEDIMEKGLGLPVSHCTYTMEPLRDHNERRKKYIVVRLVKSDDCP